jgi:hypothetical protein
MEVFSTAYLPDIIYIRQYLLAKEPVIDLGENYIKQTHRNRGVICSSNGPLSLIVPLRKSAPTTIGSRKMAEIEISYSENWQDQHLKSIRSCYKNSPYYEHYQEEFETIIQSKWSLLCELNAELFKWLLDQLDIVPKHTIVTNYIESGFSTDYRLSDYFIDASKTYKQVFSDRNGFTPGLSCIDLLFNKGPEAMAYIQ